MAVNAWELIFRQSRVNNGAYDGDELPPTKLGLAARNLVSTASTLSAPRQRQIFHRICERKLAVN